METSMLNNLKRNESYREIKFNKALSKKFKKQRSKNTTFWKKKKMNKLLK